jgi:hypothetical protein
MSVAGTLVFPSANLLQDAEAFFTQIKEVRPYGLPDKII